MGDIASFVLTLLGGLFGAVGVWLTVRRVAADLWRQQQEEQLIDFVAVYEAALGDPKAQDKWAVLREEYRSLTGRYPEEKAPLRSLKEFRRAEFHVPVALALLGIVLSTIGGLV